MSLSFILEELSRKPGLPHMNALFQRISLQVPAHPEAKFVPNAFGTLITAKS